jgi:hypothetical protein
MVRTSAPRGQMFNAIPLLGGPKVDFAPLGQDAFERSAFERRRALDSGGASLWVADVVDLVLSKLRWAKLGGSARQLADVRAIMALGHFSEHDPYFQRWLDALDLRDHLDGSRETRHDA